MGEVGGEVLHVSRCLSHVLLALLCKALGVQAQNDLLCCFHHGFEDGNNRLHGYALNGLQRRPARQAVRAKRRHKQDKQQAVIVKGKGKQDERQAVLVKGKGE